MTSFVSNRAILSDATVQLGKDVKKYVQICDVCQRRGPSNRRKELIPIPVQGPFHRIGIDIKGPSPITSNGNRYIIVAIDYFTKWPEAILKQKQSLNLFINKLFVDMEFHKRYCQIEIHHL
jgi:hypothetical protein